MNYKTPLALAGFLALGLSPSFVDWKNAQTDKDKLVIVGYYLAAMALIYYGVLKP